jgi:hypothetical protein
MRINYTGCIKLVLLVMVISIRSSQVCRTVVVMRSSSGFLRGVVCFISTDVSDKRNSLFSVG